ncbi:MAG: hypothetical protein ABSF23_14775 [Terracidiphilus sp.]
MASTGFSLVKWYLDCVTAPGEAAILYSARMRWRATRLAYSSLIWGDGATTRTSSSMRSARVTPGGQSIAVDAPQLGLEGQWTAAAAPIELTVYENASGSVLWNCLQPAAMVRLTVGGREMTGFGYAECLTLTLPPGQLPMRHLKWGRFVSEKDALVWIDWQGPYSTSIAVHNGSKLANPSISDAEISCGGMTLRLQEPASLHSGRVGETTFPGAPALAKVFPKSLFNIDERKWRSRGILETPNHESRGWVIHEAVDWNL